MVSAIGAVPLVSNVDGAVEIGDGETPRDTWRGDIEIMDTIVDILDVDRLKLGSTGAVVCGDGFDRSANFGRLRNNLYDLKVRETWCEVFLGKRAPWVCRRDDQHLLA